tara:strand:+ start:3347 stop:4513 length:1167 start_codon:yes stop_codon:yes gene_type:complete
VSKFSTEIAEFIEQNSKLNIAEIALLLSKKPDWPKEFILNQINGRQKAVKKFPFLLQFQDFEFPNPTAVAQASSEVTARFKASLINGSSIADLSGGMGIDSYFFAQKFKQVVYVEKQVELFNLVEENLKLLAGDKIHCVNNSAENFLQKQLQFDWIYIDPDRRAEKSKTFQIETSSPNIVELLPLLFEKTNQLMIKLSPLLDLKDGIRKLPFTKFIYVIAVEGECKELLFLLEKGFEGEPQIEAMNLNKNDKSSFIFKFSDEIAAQISYSAPQKYLYEPNAAILKSGGFKSLAVKLKLEKLSENTHLYTSENRVTEFPGRVVEIEKIGKPEKKFMTFANVVSRNFPMSPADIRKKYSIREGQKEFLYACTLTGKKKVFIGGMLLSQDL